MAALLLSREKADELGLSYTLRYVGGAMAGIDPTIMGGCRMVVTLNSIMKASPGYRYGLATMCVGFGQGKATIWERVT